MYLQITTKCNMKCGHCCYSCNRNGKHGDYHFMLKALDFISDYADILAIGGGEPTLHPRFFDILRYALARFDSVWMATNGSRLKSMQRLYNIITQDDWCDTSIFQEDRLTVALSQDPFHSPIDSWVKNTWQRNRSSPGFEIRDVTQSRSGIIAQGRAKRTGSGWNTDDCVCADHIIKPDGQIRLCGCIDAPVIGTIWDGIQEEWTALIDAENFHDHGCYKQLKKVA